jgi:predicted Zn-dependent protease
MLAEPAAAGDYISNFARVSAIQNRPPQVGKWHQTPAVIVCELAPISEIQINSAVQFWKRLGYEFNHTQYKRTQAISQSVCNNKNPTGYIVIHLVTEGIKMEETSLAQTRFYVDNNTNEIKWAMIYMHNDVRTTVLEHEIGHALGFLHFNQINHLMNEKWTMGGWDKEGLEN